MRSINKRLVTLDRAQRGRSNTAPSKGMQPFPMFFRFIHTFGGRVIRRNRFATLTRPSATLSRRERAPELLRLHMRHYYKYTFFQFIHAVDDRAGLPTLLYCSHMKRCIPSIFLLLLVMVGCTGPSPMIILKNT